MSTNEAEVESLKDGLRNVLAEARMVLPGVQALFGFQTMAVFNERFDELPPSGVTAYLVGLGLLALAIALLIAPAAYHRTAECGQVSQRMIMLASRFVSAGMVPLMCGLALDIYVVSLAALDDARTAAAAGVAALCMFVALWIVFPLVRRRRIDAIPPRGRQESAA
jgi:hypothetical protein